MGLVLSPWTFHACNDVAGVHGAHSLRSRSRQLGCWQCSRRRITSSEHLPRIILANGQRAITRRLRALSWSASRPRSAIGSCGTRRRHSHVDRPPRGVIRWPAYGAVPGTRRRLTMPARRSSQITHCSHCSPSPAVAGTADAGRQPTRPLARLAWQRYQAWVNAAGSVNRQVHDSAACVLVFRVVRDGGDQARQLRLSPAMGPHAAPN